ncbi:hypothetical protein MRS44_000628 [Fusarium solani]|uniref:uncharacterized protein n=1 Tax=Fusarium solani TaxID=169388 RepID=UPI0032C44CB3|nr:hypothetical protein MRS44_000628 [Fusarium solani]
MGSVQEDATSKNFVLTAQALHKALPRMGMATRAIHVDNFSSPHRAIAPPCKSQSTIDTTETLNNAGVVTYSSGLASFHAIMTLLPPKRIFIGEGYHGVHRSIKLQHRVTGVEKLTLGDLDQLGRVDLLHIETPLNPTGEARNLEYYVAKPDPLQYGVDTVMHSDTKHIEGHSDMLCGVLAVHQDRKEWVETLYQDRRVMGSIVGSFEGWLDIRSPRTLHLRVIKQSQTAEKLVSWLHEEVQKPGSLVGKMIDKVQHASLQEADLKNGWLRKQMPGGIATSLGGVESLMEWRAMSDEGRDPRLIRVSCGVEDVEDMKADILQAFESLLRDFHKQETSIAYRIDEIDVLDAEIEE